MRSLIKRLGQIKDARDKEYAIKLESKLETFDRAQTSEGSSQDMLPFFTHVIASSVALKIIVSVNILVWTSALMFALAFWQLRSRPVLTSYVPESIHDSISDLGSDNTFSRDQFDLFAIQVLTMMNTYDDTGMPFAELLKGMVTPEIISIKQEDIRRSLSRIKSQQISQNLIVSHITDFAYNPDTQRASAYIIGYLNVTARLTETNRVLPPIPYRARIYVDQETVSRSLSPTGYYAHKIVEYFGKESLAQDEKIEGGVK